MRQTVTLYDNETMEPLADLTGFLSINVDDGSDAYEYAVEDGTSRSDHIARNLIQIDVSMRLTDEVQDALAALHEPYLEHQLLALQTQYRLFQPLVIVAFPYSESVGDGDSSSIQLTLREWREVEPEYGELPPRRVASPRHADTQDRGTVPAEDKPKQAEEDQKKKQSILVGLFR